MSKLKSKDFKAIKQLVELKLSNGQVKNITGFSEATISRVKAQETWSDYQKYLKEYNVKRQHQIAIKRATSDKTYTWQPRVSADTEVDLPTDKKVDRVANALERIANALEKANEKKGWLK